MVFKKTFQLLELTYHEWNKDHVPRLGAALAFYSIFSLAPLLIIAIAVAGIVFGEESARVQIIDQVRGLVGGNAASVIETIIRQSASQPHPRTIAGLIGFALLVLGAMGVFGQLKGALNSIWNVPAKKSPGIWKAIRKRLLSFLTVLATGLLLLASLVASVGMAAATDKIGQRLALSGTAVIVIEFVLSVVVITIGFALIFRFLPDIEIGWGDIWIGAALTSLLFSAGRYLIGMYLGQSSAASAYGAAGSLIILLLWVYYSAQVFLFGAEFTHVYATRRRGWHFRR